MAQLKKILISLPDNLLKEIDSIIAVEHVNRSEFIRNAMKLYLREKKNLNFKKGYKEMAKINCEISEEFLEVDTLQQQEYENKLAKINNT